MAVPATRSARFCRSAGKHRIRFFLWLRRRTQPTRASRRVPKAARASTGECPADSSCVNTKASSSAIDAPCVMFGEGVCAASPRERRADRHSDRCQLHQSSASRRRPRGGGGARRTPLEHTAAARSRNAPGGYRPDCFLVDAGADGSERRARSRCAEAGGPARGAAAARSATASRHRAMPSRRALSLQGRSGPVVSGLPLRPAGKTDPPRWPEDPVGGLCAPPRDKLREKSVEPPVRRFEISQLTH